MPQGQPLAQQRAKARPPQQGRFPVTSKILLMVSAILLIGLVTMLVLLYGLYTVKQALHEVTEVKEPLSAAAYEMEINVIGTGLGVLKYLETGDPLYRQRVQKDTADFVLFKAQYDRLAQTPEGQQLGAHLTTLFQEFATLGNTLMARMDQQLAGRPTRTASRPMTEAMQADMKRFFLLREQLDELLDERIQVLAVTALKASEQKAEQASTYVIVLLVFLIPLFIVFAIRGGVLMVGVITEPLKTLMKGTAAIAQGDLSCRVPVRSQDEFGDLARQFNRMVAQLEGSEKTLKETNAALLQKIAEHKRAQETLARYAADLERSNQDLQDFASIASHDLQEPLRKIMAFGDRLRTTYAAVLNEQGRDYLQRMENAAQRMRNLMESLLELSRITTQARPFQPTPLAAVIAEVLGDLETRLQETRGRVEAGILPTLQADPLQMRQLFQNLLANALKFHKPEEPPFITVHSRSLPEGMWEITVADNGIGFEEKYLDRIFRPFQRLHGRSEFEGSGMGLAICRKIVARHGGTITARSEAGKGSTFLVMLPSQLQVKEDT